MKLLLINGTFDMMTNNKEIFHLMTLPTPLFIPMMTGANLASDRGRARNRFSLVLHQHSGVWTGGAMSMWRKLLALLKSERQHEK